MRTAPRAALGIGLVSLCIGALAQVPTLESACSVIAQDLSGAEREIPLPSLHVLKQTEMPGPFKLPADAPPIVSGVTCVRSSLLPARSDYKVLLAGLRLVLASSDAPDQRRQLALAVDGGRIQVQYRADQLTPQEKRALQARLDELQTRLEHPDED
jgi:hypothetical protein